MPEEIQFRLGVDERGEHAVVRLEGELDLGTSDEVEATLAELASRKRIVTVDLRGLAFMDSTAIRLLVGFDALARADGFTFFVVRGGPQIQRVLEVSGVDGHLALIDAPEQAEA
jgi:anti-anti-sigma factor